MEGKNNKFNKITKAFIAISFFTIALAMASATLIERGVTPWDIEFENIWNVSHINGTLKDNASIIRIGNFTDLFLSNYSNEYARSGFKIVNLTDANIPNDLTIATTSIFTVGGGFASGGATITTQGSGNFQDILLSGNLTLIKEGEINGSMNPSSGLTRATLGNASNQWTSSNISGNGYFGTLTSIGEVLLATSSGNVGIGTSSPTNLLEVNGIAKFNNNINITGNTRIINFTGASGAHRIVSPTGDLIIETLDTGTDFTLNSGRTLFLSTIQIERMRIDNQGKVGINITTPAQTLTVRGTLNATGNTSSGVDLFVASSGKIGIKTATPDSALSVVGNFTISTTNNTMGNSKFGDFNSSCSEWTRIGSGGGRLLVCDP